MKLFCAFATCAAALAANAPAFGQTEADRQAAIDRMHIELGSCYYDVIKAARSSDAAITACRAQEQSLLAAIERTGVPAPANRQHALQQ